MCNLIVEQNNYVRFFFIFEFIFLHRKNDFAEMSKNLARYKI